ncbi:hypothetical protein [Agromyces marinus]|uniref:Uncharacterized protein n=1 Tax=Agromyces marinus TaxID=1389020 RepID=A0ABN6YE72_9MICO|nr:hypothetical protein [Agromyces marinus]UIP59287.1 hypothetical protein DSM26151_21910 [Agromyces marinus]BDZ55694.1 hypothetical protein GCM10025870_27670 [Agromyces marinus]
MTIRPTASIRARADVSETDAAGSAATARRRRIARAAAWTAVAFLVGQFGVGAAGVLSGADVADHASPLGRASEALSGLAFLAGAVALAALAPTGARLAAWIPGVAGLAASGATMLWVVATGVEPAVEVFLAEVALTAVGLVIIGVLGSMRRRVWPWWVGVAVALLIPIMFLVPLNSIPLGLIWAAVALTARPDARS